MADLQAPFQQLLGHLVNRVDQALAQQEALLPLGMLLRDDGTLDISVGVPSSQANIQAMTVALRHGMTQAVARGGVQASCVAFPHDGDKAIVALLETRDNDAATVNIPLLLSPVRKADRDHMQVDEGYIYIFPVLDQD